jgi:hypothetical protein
VKPFTVPKLNERRAKRFSRRGGVYVLVLGVSTMIAVVGLGAIAVSRSQIRSTKAAADWCKAGIAAEAAVETAISLMNTQPTWRADYVSGGRVNVGALGGSTVGFALLDEGDGELDKGDKDNVTVYGYGGAGHAVRKYSIECTYQPPPVLPVLQFGVYASDGVTAGTAAVSGAPLGTPTLTVNGVLTSDVRVGTLNNTGTIIGEVRTGEPAITTFSDGSLSSISSRAVNISYSSLPSGTISNAVLSASRNPYGSVSSSGIYFIRVPLLSTLRITRSRINATVVIELGLTARLEITDAVNWTPFDPTLPTLIVNATALSTVRISGSSSALSEASLNVNFNPVGTPYAGIEDSDRLDSYPSEIRGVIHSINALATFQMDNSATVIGCVICQGALTITGGANVTYDPQLLIDPPLPYRTGTAGMVPVAGTWRWCVDP